ncbi:MAG: response regulator transcription factor [Treponema sp.]|nr:response regulator transcription factor [Treponema sp.]
MKIVLIDNQTAFRNGLKNLLSAQFDFDLVGVGKDGYDAITLTQDLKPDVIALDVELPVMDGFKIAASAHIHSPSSAIIAISTKMDDQMLLNAVYSGVTGFLLRNSVFAEICKAIRSVSMGKSYLSHETALQVFNMFSRIVNKKDGDSYSALNSFKPQPSHINMTRTESQIAAFVGNGFSNKQIAGILQLKEGTVRNYISLILQKNKLSHRTQIALYALNNGLHCNFENGSKNYAGIQNKMC